MPPVSEATSDEFQTEKKSREVMTGTAGNICRPDSKLKQSGKKEREREEMENTAPLCR